MSSSKIFEMHIIAGARPDLQHRPNIYKYFIDRNSTNGELSSRAIKETCIDEYIETSTL